MLTRKESFAAKIDLPADANDFVIGSLVSKADADRKHNPCLLSPLVCEISIHLQPDKAPSDVGCPSMLTFL